LQDGRNIEEYYKPSMLEDPWRHLVDAVGSKDRVPEFSVDTGNEQDLVISSNDMVRRHKLTVVCG
jgi:hypothetical protein